MTGPFAVLGQAYSADGRRFAKWRSTHMFIDTAALKATYQWEGELLDGRPTPPPPRPKIRWEEHEQRNAEIA